MYFKDQKNNLHFLSEEDIAVGGRSLLPDGSVEITDDEANHLRAASQVLSKDELNAEVDAQRAVAYRAKSDPLFFKFQRGEATKEEWLASIEAIKASFPKVE